MRFLLVSTAALLLAACSQPYGGLADSGNPGYGGGAISPNVVLIDPHTESVYVVKSVAGHVAPPTTAPRPTLEHGCDAEVFDAGPDDFDASLGDVPDAGPKHNEVWRIDPDTGATLHVSDFNDDQYTTVSFPESRLLYDIGDPQGVELRLQDQNTLAITARQPVDLQFTEFYDTISPSERYLVTAGFTLQLRTPNDDTFIGAAVFLADTRSLEVHGTRCFGGRPVWLHHGDRFAVSLYEQGRDGAVGDTRFLVYSVADLQASGFAIGSDGAWLGASPNIAADMNGATVSPDDRWFAGDTLDGHGITLVDVVNLTTRRFEGVHGPVIFTPNSSMVVAWSGTLSPSDGGFGGDAGNTAIVLIDIATGSMTFIDAGFGGAPIYFIASDGHRIVILPWIGATQHAGDGGVTTQRRVHLAVADLAMHAMNATPLIDRSAPELGVLIDRDGHNELWFLHERTSMLDRLDLTTGAYETIDLGFVAQRVGYLPMRDTFVFSESEGPAVRLWNPSTRTTVRRVVY